jgi:hypothetical protein
MTVQCSSRTDRTQPRFAGAGRVPCYQVVEAGLPHVEGIGRSRHVVAPLQIDVTRFTWKREMLVKRAASIVLVFTVFTVMAVLGWYVAELIVRY